MVQAVLDAPVGSGDYCLRVRTGTFRECSGYVTMWVRPESASEGAWTLVLDGNTYYERGRAGDAPIFLQCYDTAMEVKVSSNSNDFCASPHRSPEQSRRCTRRTRTRAPRPCVR